MASFLDPEDHRIALEEIAREGAEKYLAKTAVQKAIHTTKKFGKGLFVPNVLAALWGYYQSSGSSMLEALVQVNAVAVPLQAITSGSDLAIIFKAKNIVSEDQRNKTVAKLYEFHEYDRIKNGEKSLAYRVLAGTSVGVLGAVIYASMGNILQLITEMPVDKTMLLGVGAATTLIMRGYNAYGRHQLTQRIREYCRTHTDTIEERKGKPVDEKMLARMIHYTREYQTELIKEDLRREEEEYERYVANKNVVERTLLTMVKRQEPMPKMKIRRLSYYKRAEPLYPFVEITIPPGTKIKDMRDLVRVVNHIEQDLQTKSKYAVSRHSQLDLSSGNGEYIFEIRPEWNDYAPQPASASGIGIILGSPNSIGVVLPVFASLYGRELRINDVEPSLLKALQE